MTFELTDKYLSDFLYREMLCWLNNQRLPFYLYPDEDIPSIKQTSNIFTYSYWTLEQNLQWPLQYPLERIYKGINGIVIKSLNEEILNIAIEEEWKSGYLFIEDSGVYLYNIPTERRCAAYFRVNVVGLR
jgi:hypothetical protein